LNVAASPTNGPTFSTNESCTKFCTIAVPIAPRFIEKVETSPDKFVVAAISCCEYEASEVADEDVLKPLLVAGKVLGD